MHTGIRVTYISTATNPLRRYRRVEDWSLPEDQQQQGHLLLWT